MKLRGAYMKSLNPFYLFSMICMEIDLASSIRVNKIKILHLHGRF